MHRALIYLVGKSKHTEQINDKMWNIIHNNNSDTKILSEDIKLTVANLIPYNIFVNESS